MPTDIVRSAHAAQMEEIELAFKYAAKIALDAADTKKVTGMTFTIRFENGYAPTVSYDISEVYA